MIIAPKPTHEQDRIETLKKYDILDTPPDVAFDSIVELATQICKTPIAAISLVDEDRQWFKSIIGINASETSRDVAFCSHAILQKDIMIVPNALEDERFHDNPLVVNNPNIRFYAGVPLYDNEGIVLGTLCVIDEVPRTLSEDQKSALKTLSKNVMAHIELRYAHKVACEHIKGLKISSKIFETASEAIMVSDKNNNITNVNKAFTDFTGYSLAEVIGKNPSFLSKKTQNTSIYSDMWKSLKSVGKWEGELWNTHKNGDDYAVGLSINVVPNTDGTTEMYVGMFSDITDKKSKEESIWRKANYDSLTNLPNRNLFLDRLSTEFKKTDRNKKNTVVLFIDLDHFKDVNDSLGHEIGDILLQQVAKRFSDCIRVTDTVARFGGDEFAVILTSITDPKIINTIAYKILNQTKKTFNIKGNTINISASIGASVYPKDAKNIDTIIDYADQAMYVSKKQGKDRFNLYNKNV